MPDVLSFFMYQTSKQVLLDTLRDKANEIQPNANVLLQVKRQNLLDAIKVGKQHFRPFKFYSDQAQDAAKDAELGISIQTTPM